MFSAWSKFVISLLYKLTFTIDIRICCFEIERIKLICGIHPTCGKWCWHCSMFMLYITWKMRNCLLFDWILNASDVIFAFFVIRSPPHWRIYAAWDPSYEKIKEIRWNQVCSTNVMSKIWLMIWKLQCNDNTSRIMTSCIIIM